MKYLLVCMALIGFVFTPSPAKAFWEECTQLYVTANGRTVPVGEPFDCKIPPEAWAAMGATAAVAIGLVAVLSWSNDGNNFALNAVEDGLREFSEHVGITHQEGETTVRWSYKIDF